ncbi:hypothetical protein D3C86_2048670 [compost metagenome]
MAKMPVVTALERCHCEAYIGKTIEGAVLAHKLMVRIQATAQNAAFVDKVFIHGAPFAIRIFHQFRLLLSGLLFTLE